MGALDVILVAVGFLYFSFLEYCIHRWIVHPLSKKHYSFFKLHLFNHHRIAKNEAMIDADYSNDNKFIIGIMFFHMPMIIISSTLLFGIIIYTIVYSIMHQRCHSIPGWARRHAPWHYDHHMGPNHDANWGTVIPLWDALLCTRSHYARTALEMVDIAKAKRIANRAVRRKKNI